MPAKADGRLAASALAKTLMEGGDIPRPTHAQLQAYVEKQNYSVASLLAASQLADGSREWLQEAVKRYPDHPRVARAMLQGQTQMTEDASVWIQRLKAGDPGNALGWSYQALQSLQTGQMEDVRHSLDEASQGKKMDTYAKEEVAALKEAFRSAGQGELEAELLSMSCRQLPQATLMMTLSRELQKHASLAANPEVMQDMLELTRQLRPHDGSGVLIDRLVACAIDCSLTKQLEIYDELPGSHITVAEHLAGIQSEQKAIREMMRGAQPLLAALDDSELKQYLRRVYVEGEMKALQWVQRTKGGTD